MPSQPSPATSALTTTGGQRAEPRSCLRTIQFPNPLKKAIHSACGDPNVEPPSVSEWLTATEAAQYLKVKPRTVLKWAKEGRIPGRPLSGSKRITWRFLKSELFSMLASPSAAELWRVQP